jgi:carboxylate-amine ligase
MPDVGTEAAAETLTFGVEEEFLLVDPHSRALAGTSDRVVAAAHRTMGDVVTPELNLCQIEIASGICTTTDELYRDLRQARDGLAHAASSVGSGVAATGTHPFSSWELQCVNRDIERYTRMEERYQVIARQQVICGCHVHVGIDDPELAIEVMNRSLVWLPGLLALSANSPYWHGVDTGFASYRTEVWERWPTSGMPPPVTDRAHYDALIAELCEIDAIEDATHVYWYVRPSANYPTVEYRPCDVCLDVEDTVAIAAIIRALAWTTARDALAGRASPCRSHPAMNAAFWRAARYGLDGGLVDSTSRAVRPASEVVSSLLAYVADGLDAHGDREAVHEQVDAILRRGNGAARQRDAKSAAGGDATAVVDFVLARTAGR